MHKPRLFSVMALWNKCEFMAFAFLRYKTCGSGYTMDQNFPKLYNRKEML